MTTKIRLLHDTVGIPTGAVAVTQSASDNTTKVATTAYVTTALAALADSAPSTLNTLNELAAALGDDANFSTTVTNSIATKLPLAGGTMTGNISHGGNFKLDVVGNLTLDADGDHVVFAYGSSGEVGRFSNESQNLVLYSLVSDKDIKFNGVDGSGTINALTLDMSDAGTAIFNHDVKLDTGGKFLGNALNDSSNGYNIIQRITTYTQVGDHTNGLVVRDSGYSGGTVGIGTNSPTADLDIVSAGGKTPLRIQGGANTGVNIMEVGHAGGAVGANFIIDDNGNVGINEPSPLGKLHVKEGDSGQGSVNANFDQLVLEDDNHSGMTILSGTSSDGGIYFGDSGGNNLGQFKYKHSSNSFAFVTNNGSESFIIDSAGTLYNGASSPTLHSATRGIVFENGSLLNDVTRGDGKSITLAQNMAIDAGNTWAYLAAGEGSYYQQYNGNHYFGAAPSGSAGADATVTSKMKLHKNGILELFPPGTHNIAIGTDGSALASGAARNVMIGNRAGLLTDTGDHNVYIGAGTSGSIRGAGELNTQGQENVGIGVGALGDSDNASYNVAVGHMAMYSNTSSNANIAIGVNALLSGGGAGSNIGIGINTLKNLGNDNNGDSNTAIGYEALEDVTDGDHNIAIGYRAGMNIQGGSRNIVLGNNSLPAVTSGTNNIAIGYGVMTGSASGNQNLVMGYDAGSNLTTGSMNVIINHSGHSQGIDARSVHNAVIIADGNSRPAFHNMSHEDIFYGNVDVTRNGTSENFITCGAGATIPLFSGGNSFSGIFIINDFTRTGDVYFCMTGGGQVSIIKQTGSVLQTTSSPGSLQYGIYLSAGLGVMFKNGTGSSFNFRVLSFRTRHAQ